MQDLPLLKELIEHARSAVIVTHFSPDGDALGSIAALSLQLNSLGKRVCAILPEAVPPKFDFLQINRSEAPPDTHDVVFFLDCETPDRIGERALLEQLKFDEVITVNIDHHYTNARFGKLNFVAMASSTCEILYDIFQQLKLPMSVQLATDLLTGIIEDTGNFRYPNTSARTLYVASELVNTGADMNSINKRLRKSFEVADLAVWAKVLGNSRVSGDKRVVLSQLNLSDLPSDTAGVAASSDLLNTLLRLRSAQLVILLREMTDHRVGVSLRSDEEVDSSEIAKAIGGGGHKRAAGAIVTGTLDEVESTLLQVALCRYDGLDTARL
jgi:phosphoesterase RecJ-like protein